MKPKSLFITGLTFVLLMGLNVQSVQALYSPTISRNVSVIKEHMLSSQSVNGAGSLLSAIETIKTMREVEEAQGEETGISGQARVAQELVLENTYDAVIQNPYDSLFMVFNYNAYNEQFISNCLRDEIWSLESLRDVVGQEMIRSYLLYDPIHGGLLKEDYLYLINEIDLLRKYGSDPNAPISARNQSGELVTVSSNEYFFGMEASAENAINLYTRKYFHSDDTGCPDGEFEQAIKQVVNSWNSIASISSGENVIWSNNEGKTDVQTDNAAWGSIWDMARANARVRAKQWTAANQISLTIAGEEGAQIQSLVKGGGWDKFTGEVSTQLEIVKNMVGPVTPLFDKSLWEYGGLDTDKTSDCVIYYPEKSKFYDCDDQQLEELKLCRKEEEIAKAQGINCTRYESLDEVRSLTDLLSEQIDEKEENEIAQKEAQTAIVYAITLDSVAEEAIKQMDSELSVMNAVIAQGYQEQDKGGSSITSLTKEVSFVAKYQCSQ